ncbi:hypothetical protein [Leeuwenhoekiella sp. NPDC079379]|uniref:hypothetical protein n=1 Tax=Leeuwenhoekiella sp. NPDC079379 TaxID=3364122 RepID=UPI0037CC4E4C
MSYGDSVTALINKITRKQAYYIGLIAAVFIFLYFFTPIIVDWDEKRLDRREKIRLEELKINDSAQKMLDSIKKEKAKLENEKFLYKNAQIENLLTDMGMRIGGASSISIVSVHNGGATMLTSSESMITVIYTNEFIREVNIKKKYDNWGLTKGYGKYFLMMLEENGDAIFIEDVRNYPSIYNGDTKKNMDFLGTKSLIGTYIKAGSKGTYFLTLSFTNYLTQDNKSAAYAINQVEEAREKLTYLLDVK